MRKYLLLIAFSGVVGFSFQATTAMAAPSISKPNPVRVLYKVNNELNKPVTVECGMGSALFAFIPKAVPAKDQVFLGRRDYITQNFTRFQADTCAFGGIRGRCTYKYKAGESSHPEVHGKDYTVGCQALKDAFYKGHYKQTINVTITKEGGITYSGFAK